MWIVPLLLLAGSDALESKHLEQNPVYQDLRESGIAVTPEDQLKLVAPYLPDGLTATEQRKQIEKLGGRRYPWARLTQNSPLSPQIIQISEAETKDSKTKTRVVNVYFIAYGDLQGIADAGGLSQPEGDADTGWKALTADELAARKITELDQKHEAYGFVSNDLIDKVRVSGTLHLFWSRTDDSIIAASRLDPRFKEDPEYPSRWQPLERGSGEPKPGAAAPYAAAGGYTKITRLEEPAGALFIESHLVFAEPHGWFDGTNLLSSKLPAVIQHEVRSTRREILREAPPKPAK